ncbi:MAG: MoaD/ThiS family protein [Epsilonproteobacteria bacterium]|nr:MoaD/ThiS family protein [Campylobacterota bacterium]
MARIEFLGPIDKEPQELNIKNLNELKEVFAKDEKLEEWLSICAVAVNDVIVKSLDFKIKKNDKISLLPPVCGG